ncbi:MAG TPA: pyridoxal phosphate-dependent aminotransferase [Thermodesulfobacteriota bacterium]|nr:pyridoxal phosphate-dependent aminotransferase [Thermodesulfobacteriota bacterium]
MVKISKRMEGLEESATLAVTVKAKEMRSRGMDVIGFGAGEPDLDTPDNIKKAAIAAIDKGKTKYTAVGGIEELKDAVIAKFKRDNNLSYSREEVLVSCGGKHSIFNLFQAFLDPGDEVVIPSPYWVSYPAMVRLSGGTPVIADTDERTGFKMTAEAFARSITKKTKAIVINSPSNPTGCVYSPDELKAIAEVALKNSVFIISDEIYEKLTYGEVPFISIASISEEVKRNSIVLNGVSKTYSMTGWRIGYAAGPKELIKAMTIIQGQSTSNPASISQWAAVEAMNGPQDTVAKMREVFKKRRGAMVEGLNSIAGVKCLLPHGSFYAFANVSGVYGKRFKGKIINTSMDVTTYLLEEALVAVVPGDAFGNDNFIRLSYACSEKDIETGIKRMKDALERLG